MNGGGELFIERLYDVVSRNSDRAAVVVDGEAVFTYGQLWDASERIGRALSNRGVGKESVVGICLPKSAATIATFIGVWRCGAAWTPIESTLPDERVKFLVEDPSCELIATDTRLSSRFDGDTPKVLDVDSLLNSNTSLDRFEAKDPFLGGMQCRPSHSDLAYIIYTSGSTGLPKGVEVTHRGLVPMLLQQIQALQLTPKSRSLFLLSTSFDASVSDVGTALLIGASLFIEPSLYVDGRFQATSKDLVKIIRRREISYVDIPPSVLSQIEPEACPPCLTTILIGGEVCSPEVVRRWARRVRLLNVYGPTEATICSSLSICNSEAWKRPLIGQPLEGVEYLIDGDLNSGELLIGGNCLARGYRNRPELTAERFITLKGKTVYRTGDLVRRDNDGEYVFVGRIDRQIKLRGHRIEPREIETVANSHPDVERSVVMLVKKGLHCFVVANEKKTSLLDDLRGMMRAKLPTHAVPSRFSLLDELPTTLTGKVDFKKLEVKVKEHRLKAASSLKSKQLSSAETIIVEIFKAVLGHSDFTLDDHFFSIGGDSLRAMEVCVMSLEKGLKISPQLLVADGTIKSICRDLVDAERCGEFKSAQELRDDIDQIIASGKNLKPSVKNIGKRSDNHSILLTGASGFLGVRLLFRLLKLPQVSITCLVRGKDRHHSRQRLLQAIADNQLKLSASQLARLNVISGDVALPQFGLLKTAYDHLSKEIGKVIHSAAEVNTTMTYDGLRPSNVIAIRHVADFIREGSPKALEYISTLSVFVGTDQCQGVFWESDNLESTSWVYGGYAQSKWAAEVLLREAVKKYSLDKVRIFRLGLLTGDVETGIAPQLDLLTLTVKGLAQIGVAPNCGEHLRLDVTPVNYAADVLAYICQGVSTPAPNAFHVAHPFGLTARSLFKNLQIVCPNIEIVSPQKFHNTVATLPTHWQTAMACLSVSSAVSESDNAQSNFGKPRGVSSIDLFQATGATFDMTETKRSLAGSGLEPPQLNDVFVQRMISSIMATNRKAY